MHMSTVQPMNLYLNSWFCFHSHGYVSVPFNKIATVNIYESNKHIIDNDNSQIFHQIVSFLHHFPFSSHSISIDWNRWFCLNSVSINRIDIVFIVNNLTACKNSSLDDVWWQIAVEINAKFHLCVDNMY